MAVALFVFFVGVTCFDLVGWLCLLWVIIGGCLVVLVNNVVICGSFLCLVGFGVLCWGFVY